MHFTNLATYLIVIGMCLEAIVSRPTTEPEDVLKPWENPCLRQGHDGLIEVEPSEVSVTFNVDATVLSLTEQLSELVYRCSEAFDLVKNVTSLMHTRISDVGHLNKRHVKGFPNPDHLESWNSSKPDSIKSVLEKDNIVFQTSTVFLQQMKTEEEKWDSSSAAGNMANSFTQVIEKVWIILCQLEGIDVSRNYQFISDVTCDVMPQRMRNLTDIAYRFARDYVILRDLRDILDNRTHTYVSMLRQHNQ